jgi:hypothetical protein
MKMTWLILLVALPVFADGYTEVTINNGTPWHIVMGSADDGTAAGCVAPGVTKIPWARFIDNFPYLDPANTWCVAWETYATNGIGYNAYEATHWNVGGISIAIPAFVRANGHGVYINFGMGQLAGADMNASDTPDNLVATCTTYWTDADYHTLAFWSGISLGGVFLLYWMGFTMLRSAVGGGDREEL